MQDIFENKFELKMTFNSLPKHVSNCSHYKKLSASSYRKCKAVWCKALAIVIGLQ